MNGCITHLPPASLVLTETFSRALTSPVRGPASHHLSLPSALSLGAHAPRQEAQEVKGQTLSCHPESCPQAATKCQEHGNNSCQETSSRRGQTALPKPSWQEPSSCHDSDLAKGHLSFHSSSRDSKAQGIMAIPLKLITYAGDLDRKQRKNGRPPGDAQ